MVGAEPDLDRITIFGADMLAATSALQMTCETGNNKPAVSID
jgi:hypothetical protein